MHVIRMEDIKAGTVELTAGEEESLHRLALELLEWAMEERRRAQREATEERAEVAEG